MLEARPRFIRLLLLAGLVLAQPAQAFEYRTTARPALLYDAPSAAGARLAVAGAGLPLEVVVDTERWVKVRDPSGRLAWVEKAALGGPRNVMVKAETSAVRRSPSAGAEIVFRAARDVLLEATGNADAFGWIPVRHADGMSGWVPAHEVWGR